MIDRKVALVGVGTIGRGWAALFAKADFEVALYDPDPESIALALEGIRTTLEELSRFGLLADPLTAWRRLRPAASVAEALEGVGYVQESVPEDVDLKRRTLAELDRLAAPEAIISSSCSSLLPVEIFREVAAPGRCLIAHPFNPPHLLPLVELLVGPQTSEATLARTSALMSQLGQTPVVLRKPVPGYVVNRLQAAVVNEAMHLVAQGVISPGDLDLCMTASLGRRWSFLGPFETMDLNADDGVAGYAQRFGASYHDIGADLGVAQPWAEDAIKAVIRARRAEIPLEGLQARREWRDRRLMRLLAGGEGAA